MNSKKRDPPERETPDAKRPKLNPPPKGRAKAPLFSFAKKPASTVATPLPNKAKGPVFFKTKKAATKPVQTGLPDNETPSVSDNRLPPTTIAQMIDYNEQQMERWRRPQLERPINPKTDDVTFQQISIDYTILDVDDNSFVPAMAKSNLERIPVVRAFGVTKQSNSVMLQIYGFEPYFYVWLPDELAQAAKIDPARVCQGFQYTLNKIMLNSPTIKKKEQMLDTYVVRVELLHKLPLYYYTPPGMTCSFLKITMALPGHVSFAAKICHEGIMFGSRVWHFNTFESNILFPLRFMVDRAIVGMSWVRATAGTYVSIDPSKTYGRMSNCQIELALHYSSLAVMPLDGEWIKSAPLRILSFDLECFTDGAFPKAELLKNQIITIGNMLSIFNGMIEEPFITNAFTLNNTSPLFAKGIDVRCYDQEKDMMIAWSQFIQAIDPDIFTGYNIMNFDLTYLWERANTLKISRNFTSVMSRIRGHQVYKRKSSFSSKAYGKREAATFDMPGRLFFDQMQIIPRNFKFRSYSLNSVSKNILGDQKDELPHSIIGKLYQGNPLQRQRVTTYCVKDCKLPLDIINKTKLLVAYIEDARITGVPFSYLVERGQSIKVVSQLFRRANQNGFLIPKIEKKITAEGDAAVFDREIGYEGAVVIEPERGFYENPIPTLDFASLYPSIMIAHNLCYTTLLTKELIAKYNLVEGTDYTTTPTDPPNYFVKTTKRDGLLPMILKDLLAARKAVRSQMTDKLEKEDPVAFAILNQRQLAIKVSANSVYGFTGATIGSLPCLEVSGSVTAFGREMIMASRAFVLKHYCKANGWAYDCRVLYGDTDSIMVDFGPISLEESMRVGKEAAALVSKLFIAPINLEWEKCFYPFLLMNKKRYVGIKWENPVKPSSRDAKGFELVRRDNCPIVQEAVSECVDQILGYREVKNAAGKKEIVSIGRNIDKAVKHCQELIAKVRQNKYPMSDLIDTKAYSKEPKTKQPHTYLNQKLHSRGEKGYQMGERIPYIIARGDPKLSTSERAEDPIYAIEHNLQPDPDYYVERLRKPLTRIFEAIDPFIVEEEIYAGDHMRSIKLETPKAAAAGERKSGKIVDFLVKIHICINCRQELKPGELNPCGECARNTDLKASYMDLLEQQKKQFTDHCDLLEVCYKCQDAGRAEVQCEARDCATLFKRVQARVNMERTEQTIKEFTAKDLDW